MKFVQTSFYHMNHIHFTYKTMSLIHKRMQLETNMGNTMLGFIVLVLALLSHSLIAIIVSMSDYTYPSGSTQVGFSTVPFHFDRAVIVGILCGVLESLCDFAIETRGILVLKVHII